MRNLTKDQMVASHAYQISQKDKEIEYLQEQVEKLKLAERKLVAYPIIERMVALRAKEILARDLPRAQLSIEETEAAEDAVGREVCRTMEDAFAQIFDDFEEAYGQLDKHTAEDLEDAKADREKMLRVLGMSESEWAHVEWKY